MKKILIIDDDRNILKILPKLINYKLKLNVDTAESLKELQEKLQLQKYVLAICNYHLPDAEKGEAIDSLLKYQVPTIVLTNSYNEKLIETVLNKGVVDCLVKNISNIAELIIEVIKRALRNMETKVIVIEDSPAERSIMKKILQNMLFKIYEASSLSQSKKILESYSDIRLIVLDYYLPEENTLDFIYELRNKYKKSALGIIVVSGVIKPKMIPLLLKIGANDFLHKPFSREEFMVRINNTMDMIDLVKELEFYAYKDSLTELYNRRYFFEEAPKIWNLTKRRGLKLACIMIDIDNFKQINDTYGHDAGDIVLKDFAYKLKKFFQREEDLVARIGGEEFAILVSYTSLSKLLAHLEKLRQYIATHPVKIEDIEIKYTISIGIETELRDSIKTMLIQADKKLYKAKNKGKNCIIY